MFPLHKVVGNSQEWWKVVGNGPDTDNFSNSGEEVETASDLQDGSEQDSEGTQNTVELPEGGTEPRPVVEPAVSSAATDEAENP